MKITSEEELKKALDKLAPIFVEAYRTTLFVMALYKILDTPKPVYRDDDSTGDITK